MRLLLPLSILFLSISIFWHAQNGKYQAISINHDYQNLIDGELQNRASFIKFNTRNGKADEYCYLNIAYCKKWEIDREAKDKDRSLSITEQVEKRKSKIQPE